MNKPQKTRCTYPAGEPRDQQKRTEDLPQFSGSRNKCLQCGGDHHTANCTRRQSPSTNASTTDTGIPPQQHAPSTSRTSINNSQSPTTRTESILHVGTPTLNINAPPFPPNLHQAPLPPHVNRPNIFILMYQMLTRLHILSIHKSHHLLIRMSHHHIFCNTRRPLAHLCIVVILLSYWLYKNNENGKKN